MTLSPDGKHILVDYEDAGAHLFDISGKRIAELSINQTSSGRSYFSFGNGDGRRIYASTGDQGVHLFDRTGNFLFQTTHDEPHRYLGSSYNDQFFTTKLESGSVGLWDASGALVAIINPPPGYKLSFSNPDFKFEDQRLLISWEKLGEEDDPPRLISLHDMNGNELIQFNLPGDGYYNYYSIANEKLAYHARDNSVVVLDMNANEISRFDVPGDRIERIDFRRDGDLINVKTRDGLLHIFSIDGQHILSEKTPKDSYARYSDSRHILLIDH